MKSLNYNNLHVKWWCLLLIWTVLVLRVDSACTVGSGQCVACDATPDCTACSVGYYLDSTTKLCVTCAGLANCKRCASASSCVECKKGFFLSGAACNACTAPCASCVGTATTCVSCQSGYCLNGNICVEYTAISNCARFTSASV